MRAGKLDRFITIEEPTVTEDSFGGEVKTWAEFKSVWAEKLDVKARERFNSDQIQAVEATKWRIRWLEGVKPTMRIVYDTKVYQITGLAEIKRREEIEVTSEARDVSNA